MKVELKLNSDTINAAARVLEQVYELFAPLGQSEKVIRSIPKQCFQNKRQLERNKPYLMPKRNIKFRLNFTKLLLFTIF
jgi:hemolysin-activating ACP:hemolysin acyltransferase